MMHWGWWILGGVFLLSRQPSAVTPVGGSNPVQPTNGTEGIAIDAATGMPVTVNQPLSTTVVGSISPANFAGDSSDEAFIMRPPNVTPLLQNPDTLPGAWPGLMKPPTFQPGVISPADPAPGLTDLPAGDLRAGALMATPLFDLNQDTFIVPGLGEEDFSPGALTPDAKLEILRLQGYTGPDPRMVSTTPLSTLQDANPLINPVTGRVNIGNV